jgi:hypothetical protein
LCFEQHNPRVGKRRLLRQQGRSASTDHAATNDQDVEVVSHKDRDE